MSHKRYRSENNCLNCGTQVIGHFCHQCGQENLDTRENFFHLVGHFVSDYFHFDSKFFRSLIPLFLRPGFLTKEYWEGRRVHYIHPLRLFFFVTIIFIIASTAFYHRFGDEIKSNIQQSAQESFLKPGETSAEGRKTKITETQGRIIKKLQRGLDVVFQNLKYVTFFLLPVYALIFKLLYVRRKPFYVDHLIYAMHLEIFVYILFSIMLTLPLIFTISLNAIRQISFIILFVYVGFSLHYLYRQSWWKTFIKSVIATVSIFFVTTLTILLVALLDAMFIE